MSGRRTANEAVVWAMWRAHDACDVEGLMATLHPEVIWYPAVRPGRSVYVGRAQVRSMLMDIEHGNGEVSFSLDAVTETAPGHVEVVGTVVTRTQRGPIRFAMEMKDHLVHRVVAVVLPVEEPISSGAPPLPADHRG